MSGASQIRRQQDRILEARFPPPGSAVGFTLLWLAGFGILVWENHVFPSQAWAWCIGSSMGLGVGAQLRVVRDLEPLVATLARSLDAQGESSGGSAHGNPRIWGLGILTKWELRRIAAARLDPGTGLSLTWLFVAAASALLALWLYELKPAIPMTVLPALAAIALVVYGMAHGESCRWQPLIAALRTELGEERALEVLGPAAGSDERVKIGTFE